MSTLKRRIDQWASVRGLSGLPHGWKNVPFGKIVSSSQYGLGGDTGPFGPYPMLKMSHIDWGIVNPTKCDPVYVSLHDIKQNAIQHNDLLFNRTNSNELVGKAGLFFGKGIYFCASYIVRFRLKKEIALPEYVNYWWQTEIAKDRLRVLATPGVGQVNINPTTLQNDFFIPLPGMEDQKRFAAVLANWDRAISLTERLITAKLTLRKGLMQQLLTGKRRFPGFSEPWREVRLGDVFTNRIETNRADLPLVAITGKEGVIYRDQLDRKDTSNEDKSRYLRIAPGDIGYNTMRMWQGVCGLSAIEGIVSPAYTIVTPTSAIAPEFAALLFKSEQIINLFHRYSQGLVDDTLNLKYPHFAQIVAKIPINEEQKRIVGVFAPIDRELSLLRAQLTALKTQKRGLMQQLLTGKVRVRAPASNPVASASSLNSKPSHPTIEEPCA